MDETRKRNCDVANELRLSISRRRFRCSVSRIRAAFFLSWIPVGQEVPWMICVFCSLLSCCKSVQFAYIRDAMSLWSLRNKKKLSSAFLQRHVIVAKSTYSIKPSTTFIYKTNILQIGNMLLENYKTLCVFAQDNVRLERGECFSTNLVSNDANRRTCVVLTQWFSTFWS